MQRTTYVHLSILCDYKRACIIGHATVLQLAKAKESTETGQEHIRSQLARVRFSFDPLFPHAHTHTCILSDFVTPVVFIKVCAVLFDSFTTLHNTDLSSHNNRDQLHCVEAYAPLQKRDYRETRDERYLISEHKQERSSEVTILYTISSTSTLSRYKSFSSKRRFRRIYVRVFILRGRYLTPCQPKLSCWQHSRIIILRYTVQVITCDAKEKYFSPLHKSALRRSFPFTGVTR